MRRSRFSSLAMMSGWLFADLLLVLFLVVLGSAEGVPPSPVPTSSPGSTGTPRPSMSPSPSASRPTCPQSFELRPQRFEINGISLGGLESGASSARRALVNAMRQQIRARGMQNQYAGLILAYGKAPNSQRVLARAAALAAGQMLRSDLDRFSRVQIKEFNYETNRADGLILDVYFFVRC